MGKALELLKAQWCNGDPEIGLVLLAVDPHWHL